MTVGELLRLLRVSELWKVGAALVALLCGAFTFGAFVGPEAKTDARPNDADAYGIFLQVVNERMVAQEQLEAAKEKLETQESRQSSLGSEIDRLKKEVEEAKQREAKLKASAGIVYSRVVSTTAPFDHRGTTLMNYVRVDGGRLAVDSWAYLPSLRKVRRIDAAILEPAFSVGNRVCAGARCGVVDVASGGIIPTYRVKVEDTAKSETWIEDTLNSGQRWFSERGSNLTVEGLFERR